MRFHAGPRRHLNRLRVRLLPRAPLPHGPPRRAIPMQGIMRRGLVRHDIRPHPARLHPAENLGEHLRGIAHQPHRLRLAARGPIGDHPQRLVQRLRLGIDIPRANPEIDPRLVHFHRQTTRPGEHRRQRLRPAHAPQTARQNPAPGQRAVVMLPPRLGKGLIGPLHDPLRADVNPRPRRHLPVHHQALLIELVEMLPGRPMRHQIGVRDQHPRRIQMGFHNGNRLAGLDDQRLISLQIPQARTNPVEILPGPRRPADAAINNQFMRVFGHIGVQVVHQHPQGRLGQPRLGGDLGARGRINVAAAVAGIVHHVLTKSEGAAGRLRPARHWRSVWPRRSDRAQGSGPHPRARFPAAA